VAASHQAHSYSATGNIVIFDEPAFTIYDASLGVSKGAWNVQAYAQNLTDTRADLFSNDNQFVPAETVNRPRTIGVRLGFKF
jgi:outer membrane receptor protein involved in Fe transport